MHLIIHLIFQSHGATFIWDVALKALDKGVSETASRYILQHILKRKLSDQWNVLYKMEW